MRNYTKFLMVLLVTAGISIPISCATHLHSIASTPAPNPSRLIFTASTTDFGTRIEACARVCGTDAGTNLSPCIAAAFAAGATNVSCSGGGTLVTRLTIPSGHTLQFGPGEFVTMTSPSIVWQDSTEISGTGDTTLIDEPPENAGNVVLQSEADLASHDGPGNSNVTIHDLQIFGTGGTSRPGNGAASAISIGNSQHVSISNITIHYTHAIGCNAGGTSNLHNGVRNHAADVTVQNCLFDGVAAVSLAAVNADGFVFQGNHFHRGGGALSGLVNTPYVDLEPNTANDIIRGVISGNDLHMEDAPNNPHVGEPTIGGIAVQDGQGTTGFAVTVIDNVITGGDGSIAHPCSDQIGIFLYGATDSEVYRNTVSWMCAEGMHVANSGHTSGGGNIVGHNRIVTCGNWAIRVDTSNNHVFDNDVIGGTAGAALVNGYPWIIEGPSADNNRIMGNRLSSFTSWWGATIKPKITVIGVRSLQFTNMLDGK